MGGECSSLLMRARSYPEFHLFSPAAFVNHAFCIAKNVRNIIPTNHLLCSKFVVGTLSVSFSELALSGLVCHLDKVAEWLRRWTANPLCSARVGSNPILVAFFFSPTEIFLHRIVCINTSQALMRTMLLPHANSPHTQF